MKRYDLELTATGPVMEERKEGAFVHFTEVAGLKAQIQQLLEQRSREGLDVSNAILDGIVPDQHPMRSRLELLANHRKREQALEGLLREVLFLECRDGLSERIEAALAGKLPEASDNSALAMMMDELHDICVGLDAPGGAQNGAEAWEQVKAAIDRVLAGQVPAPAVTVTETIRTAPERIWLQVGDQEHYHSEPFPRDTSEVSWCADSVMACEVLYVRADLAGKLPEHHEKHPDDAAVDRFAVAMKTKLAAAREKGRGGWDNPATCSVEYLADLLVDHVGKGNAGTFEDVANFAMMLHQRRADPAVLASAATLTTCATCSGHGMIGGVTGQTPESMDFWEAGCPDCDGRGKVKVKTRTLTEGQEFESKILRWAQTLTEGEEFELVTRLQTIARGASADPASAALVLLNRIDSDVDWLDDPHQLPPRQGGEPCAIEPRSSSKA